jgi:hypothetical protein
MQISAVAPISFLLIGVMYAFFGVSVTSPIMIVFGLTMAVCGLLFLITYYYYLFLLNYLLLLSLFYIFMMMTDSLLIALIPNGHLIQWRASLVFM